jgi:hypothetical protein
MHCAPRLAPHLKSAFAQIAELGIIKLGERPVTLVPTP